jgi:hypothetical protein
MARITESLNKLSSIYYGSVSRHYVAQRADGLVK